MPRPPKEVFDPKKVNFTTAEKKIPFLQTLKNKFLIYSFLSVIVIEIASLFLANLASYQDFIYPLLTQVVMFILCLTLALNGNRLRFCTHKEFSMYMLCFYFLFNIIAIVFGFNGLFYTIVVTAFLILSGLTLLLSIFKK